MKLKLKIQDIIFIIIKNNFHLIALLIIYSTLSGLFLANLIYNNKEQQVVISFLLLIQELTYPAIKNILSIQIFNNAMAELKKFTINLIKTSNDSGKINTNFTKIHHVKPLIQTIFSFYKNSISLLSINYSIYSLTSKKHFILSSLVLILFIIFVFFSLKTILAQRHAAWTTTETTFQDLHNTVNQIDNIKQNLVSNLKSKQSIDQEAQTWGRFYLLLNLRKIIIAIILSQLIFITPFALPACHLYIKALKNAEANLKSIVQLLIDLSFLTESPELEIKKTHQEYLIINNLCVYNIGPINFVMETPHIIIQGINGAGKTLLTKAIAELVPYTGSIHSPKCLYLGLDSILPKNQSKGECIMEHIKLALTKDYELFMIDEVLDVLSLKNLEYILKLLQKKQLILITHKDMAHLNLDFKKYRMQDNQINEI